MINIWEVNETNNMIEHENLDVRTITLGISLLDCVDDDLDTLNKNIYEKITTVAKDLVKVGKEIENKYCIPIVNKRISITPISLVGATACKTPEDYVTIAKTLDNAARAVGVNFIGGYSALVSKGMTKSDELLIRSIPQALAQTEYICSSVNVGSTKTGINKCVLGSATDHNFRIVQSKLLHQNICIVLCCGIDLVFIRNIAAGCFLHINGTDFGKHPLTSDPTVFFQL